MLAKGGIVNTQEQDDTIDETTWVSGYFRLALVWYSEWHSLCQVSIRKENEETDKLICDEKKTKEKRSSLAAGNHRRSHSRQKRHHKGSSQGQPTNEYSKAPDMDHTN